ncbi:flagellar hook-associated protein FlgL [Paraburkholderia sp.]|uniref:flagellar hook-associated protein FlgL n=1 Tax=Paraburkholderia sp. TaxID=1926495 RepID=UPI0025D0DF00|nr:flagellar hook-associated protein FlgL [Paraburkholderia sp.]
MRIATSEIYSTSLATMENQQSQLLQIEQQVSSGVAISNPADNPLGAAQAVHLSSTSAALTQYASNQSTALTSLQIEGTALTNITTTLQGINSIASEALGGSLNDTNRAALAKQMEGYRNELLSYANASDGQGNMLFSGFQKTSQVFTDTAGKGATYNGDSGQRVIQVNDTRQIAIGDSGSSVFMSVQPLGSQQVPAGSATNTGTGVIGAVTVTDPTAATNGDSYSIGFANDPVTNALTYTVTDNSAVPPTTTPATPYTDGASISLGSGMNVTISGTPSGVVTPPAVVGDSFTVTPATASANTNVFTTIDNMIAALNQPSQNNATATATYTNAMTTGMAALSNSLSNVITIQASVGGREQELQALQTVTSNNALQTTTDLQTLMSTNMTAAISQYTQVQSALSASQKTFAQTQQLSLFQYINP